MTQFSMFNTDNRTSVGKLSTWRHLANFGITLMVFTEMYKLYHFLHMSKLHCMYISFTIFLKFLHSHTFRYQTEYLFLHWKRIRAIELFNAFFEKTLHFVLLWWDKIKGHWKAIFFNTPLLIFFNFASPNNSLAVYMFKKFWKQIFFNSDCWYAYFYHSIQYVGT